MSAAHGVVFLSTALHERLARHEKQSHFGGGWQRHADYHTRRCDAYSWFFFWDGDGGQLGFAYEGADAHIFL